MSEKALNDPPAGVYKNKMLGGGGGIREAVAIRIMLDNYLLQHSFKIFHFDNVLGDDQRVEWYMVERHNIIITDDCATLIEAYQIALDDMRTIGKTDNE